MMARTPCLWGERGNPKLAGTVASIDTTGYWRDASESPKEQGFQYNHNAETYLLTGDAPGRAMIDLLKNNKPKK